MIEVRVRFWTNDIAEGKHMICPKHAWASGVVNIEANASHGIKPGKWLPFHTPGELLRTVEKVLTQQGIAIHPDPRYDVWAKSLAKKEATSKR